MNIKEQYILSKCKTKAAYSAKLKKPRKINLLAIGKKFKVIMETKILLVLEVENVEIICHGHGELMFKNCEDHDLMESIAEEIYSVGLEK